MTKNICLINNYNYSIYLPQCLDSVFGQSMPFDKVIVVDDGSTDDSINVITGYQSKHTNLYAILKCNEGQLSTFNAALQLIDDDSQVFLLDSDDVYPENYLELWKQIVKPDFSDFTYTSTFCFTNETKDMVKNALAESGKNEFFPKTSALTRSRRCWIGNPTSCISISSDLYKKIFPYPYQEDFITRADDAIIFASSLIGAKKLALLSMQIGYRTHQNNNFYGKKFSDAESKKHDDAIDRLFKHYCSNFSLHEHPSVKEFFSEISLLNMSQKCSLRLPNYYKLWNRLIRRKYLRFSKNM